ncbi:MAG: hypothetical protein WCR06_12045, partial [bacterium]
LRVLRIFVVEAAKVALQEMTMPFCPRVPSGIVLSRGNAHNNAVLYSQPSRTHTSWSGEKPELLSYRSET